MPTNAKLPVLPYASEMFGVYQPMIGWKSSRIFKRFNQGLIDQQTSLVRAYSKRFNGIAHAEFKECIAQIKMDIGAPKPTQPLKTLDNSYSVLLRTLGTTLPTDKIPSEQEWSHVINRDNLARILNADVALYYSNFYRGICISFSSSNLSFDVKTSILLAIENYVMGMLSEESAVAGAILEMIDQRMFSQLETIFYEKPTVDLTAANQQISAMLYTNDPFATFDPKKDIKNVSLSPLGIVHLFRQYFFELDTFLGTPTSHVWLSPGSTVELIEVSTRRTLVEQTFEQSTETTQKTESSSTDKDELSDAVKSDNKRDLKLGASLTVNQSWGTGNATATGSLNMENTQNTARETTHKRMREQSTKLSTELKQNVKSTFKTITETTDTSSKRYVLSNSTPDLINYELRRKMRQVGVQVQDIGTYLCWETFVDDPGQQLGLANLVHIAKPADLVSVPDPAHIRYPEDKSMPFTAKLIYNFGSDRQINSPDGFLPLKTPVGTPLTFGKELPDIPDGYDIVPDRISLEQLDATGTEFRYIKFGWKAKIVGKEIILGIELGAEGYKWSNQIDFVVGGVIQLTASSDKRKEIDVLNKTNVDAATAATEANKRKTQEEFIKAAKDRIEIASGIDTRKYENLREEERIIVYRKLIATLMSENNTPERDDIDNQTRHVLSELINSIFDIDKMLYFVAPDWWKPKKRHFHQTLGDGDIYGAFTGNLVSWSDLEIRPDNYFITEKSRFARMGSSLGWLLQLDGDDLRNAFLNAPWVKAVIPIRPGKEVEAINWLQQIHVEGTDGLDNLYQAVDSELNRIRATLDIGTVTIRDAITFLCAEVAAKHKESLTVGRYPKEEIHDDNRVSATPIDKVYEHGFYPLKGGFRAVTSESYEVFDQWTEVVPTDQVVPVEVKYDPKTGRQI